MAVCVLTSGAEIRNAEMWHGAKLSAWAAFVPVRESMMAALRSCCRAGGGIMSSLPWIGRLWPTCWPF